MCIRDSAWHLLMGSSLSILRHGANAAARSGAWAGFVVGRLADGTFSRSGADGLLVAGLRDLVVHHFGVRGNLLRFFGRFRFLAKGVPLFRGPAGMTASPAGDVRRKSESRRC